MADLTSEPAVEPAGVKRRSADDGAVAGRGDAYAQTVPAIRTLSEALGRLGLGLGHVVKTGV